MSAELVPADWLALGLRGASLIAAFEAAGAALSLALLGSRLERARHAIATLGTHATFLALVLTAAQHGAEAGRLAGSVAGIADVALQRLLLASDAGLASAIRMTGLLALLAAFRTTAPHHGVVGAALVGAGLVAASFALMGHTAAHPQRGLLAPLLAAHVGTAAFWFGALRPLLLVVDHERPVVAAQALSRFSAVATALVPAILAAGLCLAAVLAPQFFRLATPFDRLLASKIAAFAVLMLLAAANKWRFAPRIATRAPDAARALRVTIRLEWLVIAAVLGVTTLMTGLYSPHG